jgi:hypothetical protein
VKINTQDQLESHLQTDCTLSKLVFSKTIVQKGKLGANAWDWSFLAIATMRNAMTKILRLVLYIPIMIEF